MTLVVQSPRLELGLPPRPPGRYSEPLEFTLEAHGYVIGRWEHVVEYDVAPIDEVVGPVDSPEMRSAIREALHVEMSDQGSATLFTLVCDARPAGLGPVHLAAEVLIDGKVAGSLAYDEFGVLAPRSKDVGPHYVLSTKEDRREFARESITLRITGDQRAAVEDFDADRYWSGTMDVALAELMRTPEQR